MKEGVILGVAVNVAGGRVSVKIGRAVTVVVTDGSIVAVTVEVGLGLAVDVGVGVVVKDASGVRVTVTVEVDVSVSRAVGDTDHPVGTGSSGARRVAQARLVNISIPNRNIK